MIRVANPIQYAPRSSIRRFVERTYDYKNGPVLCIFTTRIVRFPVFSLVSTLTKHFYATNWSIRPLFADIFLVGMGNILWVDIDHR